MNKNLHSASTVIELVLAEIGRQNARWGEQNHSLVEWIAILGEEFGEASQAAVESHFRHSDTRFLQEELIQVAAVAIQAYLSVSRNHHINQHE